MNKLSSQSEKIRVLLVDDHQIVRQGFRRILEENASLQVVGEAVSGDDAVRLAVETEPDVVVLDLTMPGGISGLEAARRILARSPQTRILVLSMHRDEAYFTEALEAGAAGYLLKDSTDVELVQAILAVYAGKSFLSSSLTSNVLKDYLEHARSKRSQTPDTILLTAREREVLCLVAAGKSSKEISQILNVSPNTVETHRARCMSKLDLHSTAELVLYAVRKGLIS